MTLNSGVNKSINAYQDKMRYYSDQQRQNNNLTYELIKMNYKYKILIIDITKMKENI